MTYQNTSKTEDFAARLLVLEGNPFADNQYDDMGMIEGLSAGLAESRAEAAGEAAMFGDSWAGSARQHSNASRGIADLRREARFLREALGLDLGARGDWTPRR